MIEPGAAPQARSARQAPLRGALAGIAGLAAIGWLWVVLQRLRHPFELEWQEGGMLLHVARVRAGLPLFVEPSLDFTPFPYPPLFAQVAALLPAGPVGGLLALRLVSIFAALGVGFGLWRCVRRATGAPHAAAAAVGVWFAGYGYAGCWTDVGRVDSLAWALTLASYALLTGGRSTLATLVAAAVGIAACWTKQTALVPLAALALGATLDERRVGLTFGAVLLAGNALVALLAHGATGGWSTFHLFELLAGHPTHAGFGVDLARDLAWLAPSLLVLLLGARHLGARHAAFLLGLLAATALQRSHIGAFDNVRLPALLAAALGGGLALGRVERRSAAAAVLMLAQLLLLARDPRPWIPTEADRAAGERVVAELADRDGPVIVLGHPYLAARAGHAPTVHLMAWLDLSASEAGAAHAERLNAELTTRARSGALPVLVAGDWGPGSEPLRAFVEGLYRPDHRFFLIGDDATFLPVTGAARRPQHLYARPRN